MENSIKDFIKFNEKTNKIFSAEIPKILRDIQKNLKTNKEYLSDRLKILKATDKLKGGNYE